MGVGKKLLQQPITRYFASWVLAGFIFIVKHTNKIEMSTHPEAEPFIRGEENGIFAFWHGRMMLLPAFCPPKRQMHVLISLHRDGTLISQTIQHFGQKTVSGSTSRGGKKAVQGILKLLDAGDNIAITPDGPRGPAYVSAKGVSSVAKLSGKPVLPVTFSASRAKRLRSWDRFMLALPFGRIRFFVGKPIFITKDISDEEARMQIQNTMNALIDTADNG